MIPKKRRRRSSAAAAAGAAAAAIGAALLLGGCGTGGIDRDASTSGGKELFVSKCGSCHALADAGTTGRAGPDLDAAFGPSRAQGFKESTVREIVRDQIEFPSPAADSPGFPVMPADLVKGEDADAVAAYVASVAGTGAAPTPPPTPTTTTPTTPTTTGQTTTGQTTTAATTGQTTTEPTPSGGDAATGESLYASLGCGSCHSIDGSAGVGPPLNGLFGAEVQLTNGQTVKADDAYLIESIEDPDAQIVRGYAPGVMSAAVKPNQIAEEDARDLVAYIKTLK